MLAIPCYVIPAPRMHPAIRPAARKATGSNRGSIERAPASRPADVRSHRSAADRSDRGEAGRC